MYVCGYMGLEVNRDISPEDTDLGVANIYMVTEKPQPEMTAGGGRLCREDEGWDFHRQCVTHVVQCWGPRMGL